MSQKMQKATATIYPFPVRTRATPGAQRPQQKDSLAENLERTTFGSGWYHEAALSEAALSDAELSGRRH